MKALSMSQPWAAIVAEGFKTIENRSQQHGFRTPFPQRVLIHAAKSYDASSPLWIIAAAKRAGCSELIRRAHQFRYNEINVGRGALIGVCDFIDAGTPTDIAQKYPDDAAWIMEDAAWCYVVRNAHLFEQPIPYRGQLGFFEVEDDIVASAMAGAQ